MHSPYNGGVFRIANGGVTPLPPFVFTNTTTVPIQISAKLTPASQEYLTRATFMFPSMTVVMPGETANIIFDLFKVKDPGMILFEKGDFEIEITEVHLGEENVVAPAKKTVTKSVSKPVEEVSEIVNDDNDEVAIDPTNGLIIGSDDWIETVDHRSKSYKTWKENH